MKNIAMFILLSVIALMQVAIFTKVDYLKKDVADIQEQIGTTICLSSAEQADNSLNETEN